MKTIFYTFIFLFLTVLAYAQKTVTYVSFFPPANIAHNEVVLVQDENSFSYDDLNVNTNNPQQYNYAARKGGLMLGAKHNSLVTINNISIISDETTYAIKKFQVDNLISVTANGFLREVKIGDFDDNCNSYLCGIVNISAYKLKFPSKITAGSFTTGQLSVRSANRAWLSNLRIKHGNNNYYSNFPPRVVPAYPNSNISDTTTTNMTASHTIQWRYLRINGTEKCDLYLTLNAGNRLYDPYGQPTTCRYPDPS